MQRVYVDPDGRAFAASPLINSVTTARALRSEHGVRADLAGLGLITRKVRVIPPRGFGELSGSTMATAWIVVGLAFIAAGALTVYSASRT